MAPQGKLLEAEKWSDRKRFMTRPLGGSFFIGKKRVY